MLGRAKAAVEEPERLTSQGQQHVFENLTVNVFMHRACNYNCVHCFHTSKNGMKALRPIGEWKQACENMIKEIGVKRVTFTGGEPLLNEQSRQQVGELAKWLKLEKGISTSIVTNCSKVEEHFMVKYAQYLDTWALSIDSFEAENLARIGRTECKPVTDKTSAKQQERATKAAEGHMTQIRQVRKWIRQHGPKEVAVKINTVVQRGNKLELMADFVRELDVEKWKCFQILILGGENAGGVDTAGKKDRRDARPHQVTSDEYQGWCDMNEERLRELGCQTKVVRESNELMQNSYLLVDESFHFLDCSSGNKIQTKHTVLDDPVAAAKEANFDLDAFRGRDGEWRNTQAADGGVTGLLLPAKWQQLEYILA